MILRRWSTEGVHATNHTPRGDFRVINESRTPRCLHMQILGSHNFALLGPRGSHQDILVLATIQGVSMSCSRYVRCHTASLTREYPSEMKGHENHLDRKKGCFCIQKPFAREMSAACTRDRKPTPTVNVATRQVLSRKLTGMGPHQTDGGRQKRSAPTH